MYIKQIIIYISFQYLVFAESVYNFTILSHAESSGYIGEHYLDEERFFRIIEEKSIPHTVLRLYDVPPFEYENLVTTVYAVQELIDGRYIGQKFNSKYLEKDGKKIIKVSVSYFTVDTNTVKKYHKEILNHLKAKQFKIFESNQFSYEGSINVLWDIRGLHLGEPIWRFSEEYEDSASIKNPLYSYLIKSSKQVCLPPIAIEPGQKGGTIYYKLAE